MNRLSIVLLIAVLCSALYLVHTQYESRQLFTELDSARNEAHRLEVEADRLRVEKRGQATPLRVEALARDKLKMRTATPAITQYVADPGEGRATASIAAAAPVPAPTPVSTQKPKPAAAAAAAAASRPAATPASRAGAAPRGGSERVATTPSNLVAPREIAR
jgi:cell division protein FtsL